MYEKNVSTAVETSYYFAGSSRIAMRKGGVLSYFAADHLGSTSLTMDASGNSLGTMGYKPFGETRYGTTPTDRKFTGQRQEDSSLGSLYDYGARFYSPVLGRFLSPDTVVPDTKNPQAWNRYAYVVNNPLKYNDPTGHCFFLCALVGAAIGAVVGAVSYTANAISNRSGWDSNAYWSSVEAGAGAGAMTGATLGTAAPVVAEAAATTLAGASAATGSGTLATMATGTYAAATTMAGADTAALGWLSSRVSGASSAPFSPVPAVGTSSGTQIYRGLEEGHPQIEIYNQTGVVMPRGGSATLEDHVLLNKTESNFTSWTADSNFALDRAGEGGTVLTINLRDIPNPVSPSYMWSPYLWEKEWTIMGPVNGATIWNPGGNP